MTETSIRWPKGAPGSDEAIKHGCTCPVLDNAHGAGIFGLGRDWYISGDCPVHAEGRDD